jgi:uncharacterized membrane protein (DUF485 family)
MPATSPNGDAGRAEASRTSNGGPDWVAVERSPEFRELAGRRRRFIVRASVFFLAFFLTYLLLTAFAQDFMGTEIAGMPLAFLLAVAQVLMTWAVTLLSLRVAERELEPLEHRAAEAASRRLSQPIGGAR